MVNKYLVNVHTEILMRIVLFCDIFYQETIFLRDTGKNKADTILINGKGRTENGPKTPFATFNVKSGFRYRFRIISPGFTLCPIEVSVENHNLTLIASDTHSIVPMEVTSFIVHEGERYVINNYHFLNETHMAKHDLNVLISL